jgi:hypothetical protein
MDKNRADKRTSQPKSQSINTHPESGKNAESLLSEKPIETYKAQQDDWINEENAWFLLSTLLSGKICRPTPYAEIARDCPAVWQRALRVFAGNKSAARKWLETRSSIFDGRRPIAVALQIGGRQKVMQVLKRLSGSKQ